MTLTAAMQASTSLLAQLLNPAVRALALSVIVGFGLAAFRVRNTSVRLFTWTAVLYAALAMPLLQRILPPLPVPAPAFLQDSVNAKQNQTFGDAAQRAVKQSSPLLAAERPQNAAHGKSRGGNADAGQPQGGEGPPLTNTQKAVSADIHASSSLTSDAQPTKSSIPWTILAVGIYLTVALILLARFFIGLTLGHRLQQRSQPIDDEGVTQRLVSRASACGLNRVPQAAESEFISVPLTMGVLRPTILLPASWREWDNAKLNAVVAHEVSHVARRDAFTQRLSLLHRAFFWFSPLSWWLDRHLADLAEQASDEAALSSGADCKHYARILLGFFEALQAAPGRVWWQGVSMAKAGQAGRQAERQAEQRVERILAWKGSVAMHLKKSFAVAVVALAVPVVYLAAAAFPTHHIGPQEVSLTQNQNQTPPPPAPSEVAPPPPGQLDPALAPAIIHGTIRGGIHGIPAPELAPSGSIAGGVVAPVMPEAPVAPFAPPAVWSDNWKNADSPSKHGRSYAYGFDDEQRFVIVSGKTESFTMSGSSEDARHAEKLKKTIPGDFIWFQRDEKSYIIRDQATVDRARQLWFPQEELGKKQEALGKQQEALGKQQEELGTRMERIRVNVPDMTAQLDKLRAELKQLSSGATADQIGNIQSEIGELQSKLGEIQSHAGDQQGKLGEEMGALGEKQGKLGEEQGKLGEEQGKLAEQATRDMKQLLDEAITKGTAQPEP